MKRRSKPYFWASWLTGILAGDKSCLWNPWLRGNFQYFDRIPDPSFDSAEWKERHTRLLTSLRADYGPKSAEIFVEEETAWRIEGRTAILAGKMDLVTVEPFLVIDAKTGKPKASDSIQIKIYQLALQRGAVPGIPAGDYLGLLHYADQKKPIEIDPPGKAFATSLFELIARLAKEEPKPSPGVNECKFCDLADCTARITEGPAAIMTEEF